MPTIQDVAKRAGVAPITVSRVVNNSGYVTQGVRDRVHEAIRDLGYVPNTLARSLRSRRTHTLALMVSDLTNPFFTTVARGVADAASDAGFMVIVCNTDERTDEERKYLRMLLEKRVDGVLLVPARGPEESLRLLRENDTAVVVLDRRVTGNQADGVRCDSVQGAYRLGELLVSLGHRRVAVLAGPEGVSTSDDRVLGFQRAMAEAGAADCSRIYRGEYTQESGYRLARKALAESPRPTAFFAGNNFIAIGAMRAIRDAGLSVPEEAALVSFDDLPSAMVMFPFLTVVAQPAYDIGKKAVELLLHRLNGGGEEPYQEVILPMEVIVRQSSGGRVNPV